MKQDLIINYRAYLPSIRKRLEFISFETRDGDFIAGARAHGSPIGYLLAVTDLFQDDAEQFLEQLLGLEQSPEYLLGVTQADMNDEQRDMINNDLEYGFAPVTQEDVGQGIHYGGEVRQELTPQERTLIKDYHWIVGPEQGVESSSVTKNDFVEYIEDVLEVSEQSAMRTIGSLDSKGFIIDGSESVTLTARTIVGWHVMNDLGSPLQAG